MAYDGRYDNPNLINAFLADMRIGDPGAATSTEQATTSTDTKDRPEAQGLTSRSGSHSDTNTNAMTSAASSPPPGIRAPPPTPESRISTTLFNQHLPPIDEDPKINQVTVGAPHKELKPAQHLSPIAIPFSPGESSEIPPSVSLTAQDSASNDFANAIQNDQDVKNYQQNAFAKFKEQALARIALRESETKPETNESHPEGLNPTVNKMSGAGSAHLQVDTKDEDSNNTSSVSAEAFRDTHDESTAICSDSDDGDDASVEIIVDAPKSPGSLKSQNSAIPLASPGGSAAYTGTPARKGIQSSDPVKTMNEPNDGIDKVSREDAIYFSTWGTPSIRATSPARVRRIILSNIPASADFTLVHSLIHGGAIEHMILTQAPNGSVTALVMFTDANACDSYYAKYPNGLDFKYKGNKHTAFISKGQDVDVVSGALRTQLECGASRVVRAAGADDDWSMRALYRVAEGKGRNRKVETIVDNYRNDSRTITFRFTKIADAVTFRGQLLRDSDWEGVDIQFMPDPCEKATGIHFD